MMLPPPLKILKGFGRRKLTGKDFVDLCAKCGIELVLSAEVARGFYYFVPGGRHTIVLSTHLTAHERAFVGWHEFAHFLQNYFSRRATAAFSNVDPNAPDERLADVFATICLRPDHVRITGPQDFIRMIMHEDEKL